MRAYAKLAGQQQRRRCIICLKAYKMVCKDLFFNYHLCWSNVIATCGETEQQKHMLPLL